MSARVNRKLRLLAGASLADNMILRRPEVMLIPIVPVVVVIGALGWAARMWRRRSSRWLMSPEWRAQHVFGEDAP
jgi:hypothetical protein